MEEARRKLRICLIFVVSLAVLFGCIYYFHDIKGKEKISEGTLVRAQTGLHTGAGDREVIWEAADGREK